MNRTERIEQIMDEMLQAAMPGYTLDQLSAEKKAYLYKEARSAYAAEEQIEALRAVSDYLHERQRSFIDRIMERISRKGKRCRQWKK